MERWRSSALLSAVAGVIALTLGLLSVIDGRTFDALLGFVAAGMGFGAAFMVWHRQTRKKP